MALRPRLVAAFTLISLSLAVSCGESHYDGPTITVTGVTYEFSTPDPVVDAVVSIAEYPELKATTDENGVYVLEAPDGIEFTPVVTHPDYKTMHVQTFQTSGEGLTNVFFQMVRPGIYDGLAILAEIVPDPDCCQIASTVSEKAIQDMTFAEFSEHGAHGVAGATVRGEPSLDDTIYFSEKVFPDRDLTETSRDGGVLWGNVPPGRYVFTATHPDRSFESFVAICEPGRLINANPPWGLRER